MPPQSIVNTRFNSGHGVQMTQAQAVAAGAVFTGSGAGTSDHYIQHHCLHCFECFYITWYTDGRQQPSKAQAFKDKLPLCARGGTCQPGSLHGQPHADPNPNKSSVQQLVFGAAGKPQATDDATIARLCQAATAVAAHPEFSTTTKKPAAKAFVLGQYNAPLVPQQGAPVAPAAAGAQPAQPVPQQGAPVAPAADAQPVQPVPPQDAPVAPAAGAQPAQPAPHVGQPAPPQPVPPQPVPQVDAADAADAAVSRNDLIGASGDELSDSSPTGGASGSSFGDLSEDDASLDTPQRPGLTCVYESDGYGQSLVRKEWPDGSKAFYAGRQGSERLAKVEWSSPFREPPPIAMQRKRDDPSLKLIVETDDRSHVTKSYINGCLVQIDKPCVSLSCGCGGTTRIFDGPHTRLVFETGCEVEVKFKGAFEQYPSVYYDQHGCVVQLDSWESDERHLFCGTQADEYLVRTDSFPREQVYHTWRHGTEMETCPWDPWDKPDTDKQLYEGHAGGERPVVWETTEGELFEITYKSDGRRLCNRWTNGRVDVYDYDPGDKWQFSVESTLPCGRKAFFKRNTLTRIEESDGRKAHVATGRRATMHIHSARLLRNWPYSSLEWPDGRVIDVKGVQVPCDPTDDTDDDTTWLVDDPWLRWHKYIDGGGGDDTDDDTDDSSSGDDDCGDFSNPAVAQSMAEARQKQQEREDPQRKERETRQVGRELRPDRLERDNTGFMTDGGARNATYQDAVNRQHMSQPM